MAEQDIPKPRLEKIDTAHKQNQNLSNFLNTLLGTVKNFICQHTLIQSDDRILVAVSGGADSVALLCLLHKLCNSCWSNIKLAVVSVDHALRPESSREVAWVGNLAKQLGLEFFTTRLNLDISHIGLEERARIARYEFLLHIAKAWNATKVAVAHHADDQVETTLLHLFQGAGLQGLVGIPVQRQLDTNSPILLIRPLLSVHKQDLVSYLQACGQTWWEDSSNNDPHFTRNCMRLQIIPFLKQYFPKIDSAITNTSQYCQRATSYLELQASTFVSQYAFDIPTKLLGFNRLWQALWNFSHNSYDDTQTKKMFPCLQRFYQESFPKFNLGLQSFILRHLQNKLGRMRPLRQHDYIAFEQAIAGKKARFFLPDGTEICRSIRYLDILVTSPFPPIKAQTFWLGNNIIQATGQELQTSLSPSPITTEYITIQVCQIPPSDWDFETVQNDQDHLVGTLALDTFTPPLTLRTPCLSDTIKLLGFPSEKKIIHILRDVGIPEAWRGLVWIVVSADDIPLWIPGIGIAHTARLTQKSQMAIQLTCKIGEQYRS